MHATHGRREGFGRGVSGGGAGEGRGGGLREGGLKGALVGLWEGGGFAHPGLSSLRESHEPFLVRREINFFRVSRILANFHLANVGMARFGWGHGPT